MAGLASSTVEKMNVEIRESREASFGWAWIAFSLSLRRTLPKKR